MPKQANDDPTVTLTLTLDEAKVIAPALTEAGWKVAKRDCSEQGSGDVYGEFMEAAETYATLSRKARQLYSFCRQHGVASFRYSDGRRDR